MAEKKTATKTTKTAKETKPVQGVVASSRKKAAPKKKAKLAAEAAAPARACKVEKCKREYRAKGYCKTHYRMWRQEKFGRARFKTCNDRSDCRQPMAFNRFGYCETHFQNYYVKGIEVTQAPAAPAKKAEEKVA